ncbi:MAG: DUF1848 family protein [Candidatus Odinarchaeota archaeon]
MVKQIISASRRSDLPAFYWSWVKKGVIRGHVEVEHPFTKLTRKVQLNPELVAGFVFWSKNYIKFLKDYDFLEIYREPGKPLPIFFQFTINSHIELLEPHHSSTLDERIDQARELIEITSPDALSWRFDPIVHWQEDEGIKNNLKHFDEIALNLADAGVNRCTFSFATLYYKIIQRVKKKGIKFIQPNLHLKKNIVKQLREITKPLGIQLYICCQPDLYKMEGIRQSHCIDGNLLAGIWRVSNVTRAKERGQRESCGCTKSIDIGSYSIHGCKHSCLYCYASPE